MKRTEKMIVANWKMNGTIEDAIAFCKAMPSLNQMLYLALPFTCLHPSAALEIPLLQIGAQNMHNQLEGAYTGEISAIQLKDAKADFVLLGHSERRHIFKEDDSFINLKVLRALEEELYAIVCVGETLIQRQNKQTEEVLKNQLLKTLERVDHLQMGKIAIAYEPVWAIGSGEPATAQMIQQVHYYLRKVINETWGIEVAEKTPILYGGSVSETNVQEIVQQPDVDGVLVGGASLKADSFIKIINLIEKSS